MTVGHKMKDKDVGQWSSREQDLQLEGRGEDAISDPEVILRRPVSRQFNCTPCKLIFIIILFTWSTIDGHLRPKTYALQHALVGALLRECIRIIYRECQQDTVAEYFIAIDLATSVILTTKLLFFDVQETLVTKAG